MKARSPGSFSQSLGAFALFGVSSIAIAIAATGCRTKQEQPGKARKAAEAPVSAAVLSPSTEKPHFLKRIGEGPVEPFVQEQVELGETEGRRVLVYVGATWCEPCQRFHEALERGELDAKLRGTRFLEFDADRDGKELDRAGYKYRFIPVFALPDPDGRGSGRMFSGSIKGPEAVERDLVPRLTALLDGRRVD